MTQNAVQDTEETGTEGPRTRERRKDDAVRRLAGDLDVWVATASREGVPTLVPLTFWWDGEAVWLSTRPDNPTGVNLQESGTVRLCFGTTRDVVQVEGSVQAYTAQELPPGVGDGFTAKDGWDPRLEPVPYDFYRVTPQVLRAWGTVAELKGRLLMRDGAWLV